MGTKWGKAGKGAMLARARARGDIAKTRSEWGKNGRMSQREAMRARHERVWVEMREDWEARERHRKARVKVGVLAGVTLLVYVAIYVLFFR